MRTCPRCSYYLVPLKYGAVQVDHCHRCGGTWLDGGESLDIIGVTADPSVWEGSGAVRAREQTHMRCPVEQSALEMVRLAHGDDVVEVDHCTQCHGIWLDRDEAGKVSRVVLASGQESDHEPGFWTFLFQAVSGTPIEVWNPVRQRAWMTIGTMVALALVFVYELVVQSGSGDAGLQRFVADFGYTPAYILAQPWTLITYALLHGGVLHLLGNLYFLYIFGDNVEDSLGRWTFAVVFGVTAIAGALAQHLVDLNTPVVGASGAIAGLMGAYMVLFPRVKVYVVFFMRSFKIRILWYMGIWIGLQFLIALQQNGAIAWMVHLGGFAAGALIALPYRRNGLDTFINTHTKARVEKRMSMVQGIPAIKIQ